MSKPYDTAKDRDALRERIIGLGERSLRKTYYPELQEKLAALERFRALLDQSNDCIFLLSIPSLFLVDVNESACRQVGYSRDELLSLSLVDLVPEETIAAIDRLIAADGNGEREREMLVTFLPRRGEKDFPAEITFRVVTLDKGDRYGVVVARDITERKRAEEVLRTQFSQISTIFDSLNALVFVSDIETGDILYINRYGTTLFGDDWQGKNCHDLFPAAGGVCSLCGTGQLLADGEPLPPIASEFFNKGTGRWYQCMDRAIRWTDGRFVHLEIAVDITEFKEIERLKDEMISAVSHEMRTPLTAIIGFTDFLLTEDVESADQKSYLTTVSNEAERLNRMVQNFIDLQRMRSGQHVFTFQSVAIKPLLEEAIGRHYKVSAGHTLTLECPAVLPAVRGDAERLREVMINLLSNAIKYSPKGGRVAVAAAFDGKNITISVKDQGIGIPAELQSLIFERLYRVDNTDRRLFSGAGLGLAVVREIVVAHGGRVWVESTPGRGSAFYVQLPAEK